MSASNYAAENLALETAIDLANRGYPVLPVYPDRSAALLDWPHKATTDLEQIRRWFGPGSSYLVGMVTGSRSGVDVLDVDPRNGGDLWLAEHAHLIPETRRQTTGRGGYHYFFQHQQGLRCSIGQIAPGVDVKADGGYVVAWSCAGMPLIDADVTAWPPELLPAAATKSVPGHSISIELQRRLPPSAAQLVETLGRMPNPPETSRSTYIEVMLAAQGCITALEQAGILADEDRVAIADAAISWAERWEYYKGTDERAKWEEDWSQHGGDLAGWQTIERIAGQLIPGYREERAKAEFLAEPLLEPKTASWQSKLLRTEKGQVKSCVANAVIALRHHPKLRGLFIYNEFANTIELTRQPPWANNDDFLARQSTDTDAIWLTCFLQSEGVDITENVAGSAILAAASERAYHPVRDYLNSLAWDGTPRIDTWVIDYLGVEDTPLHRAYSARFLIGAVARVMQPGCKLDTVPVFEGRQGLLKSTALRILAGDTWFCDHIPDLASKDAMQQLQGMWIIEHAEFDKLSKADVSRAKAFLSTATDRFRRPYGKVTENFPRQSVMAVTLNRGAGGYLVDETGNRRYWAMECGVGWPDHQKVDASALRRKRDQFWAEAVHRHHAGEPWWLTEHEFERMQAEGASERLVVDPWQEGFEAFLADKIEVTLDQIFSECLGEVALKNRTHGQAIRAGRVLTTLGWNRHRVRLDRDGNPIRNGKPGYIYRRRDE